MRRVLAGAALLACGCTRTPRAAGHDAGASELGTPVAATEAKSARELAWPKHIESVLFTRDGSFVSFQDETRAVLLDLRTPEVTARNARGPFAQRGGWQTFDLPMENNATYADLGTVHAGAYGIVEHKSGPVQLEDLATGHVRDVDGAAYEAFTFKATATSSIVTAYEGRSLTLPPGLRPLDDGSLLTGDVERAGVRVHVAADPRTGKIVDLEPEEHDAPTVTPLGSDRARILALRLRVQEDGEKEFPRSQIDVYELASGKRVHSVTSRGLVMDYRASADGAFVAWADMLGRDAKRARCGASVLDTRSGRVVPGPLGTCYVGEDGPPIRLVAVEAERVVTSGADLRAFLPARVRGTW